MIIALSIGASSAFSLFSKQDSKLAIVNDTINQGDDLSINLTGNDKNPIANVTVNITVTDGDGINQSFSNVTDKNGIAVFKIDKNSGNYTVNCTFAGDENINASAISQNVTVKEVEEVSADSGSEDSGEYYSEQAGGVIYPGEIHEGPDGNRYVHLGNNEWQLVE